MAWDIPVRKVEEEQGNKDYNCSHCCDGLIYHDLDSITCCESINDTFFHAFHNFYLEHQGHYLILFFNPQGQVLSSFGNKDLKQELKERGLTPGTGWSKDCQNLFITSLKEDTPFYHRGPQESCFLLNPFSIITIPLHPNGEVVGLVGLLGRSGFFLETLYPKVKEFIEKIEQDFSYFSPKDLLSSEGSLEKVLASMVHEIKNPLMLIRGNAQLGKMLSSTSEKDKKFTRVLSEVDSLITMIDNMVLMYKKNQVDYSPNDLHILLDDVLGVIDAELKLKKLILKKDLLAKEPVFKCHYNLIRQAFLNLIRNCIQFMDEKGVLSVSTDNPKKDELQIVISDTGPGIEEQEISRIFLPFYSTREEGTGLGLAIVKKIIVYHHGGSIRVESVLGEGSIFTITFPLNKGY